MSIVDYISYDSPDAAQRLKDDIHAKVKNLLTHPEMYKAGRVPGTREMVIRSNYVVIYCEDDFTVTILRVLHGARQWPVI